MADMAKNMEWEDVRDQFRTWREDNSRHSEDVIHMWVDFLEYYKEKLGDERWMVEEQVFIAALDCGRFDISNKCFTSLSHQFPESFRVLKLKGLKLEAFERFEDAQVLYDSLIREDETNSSIRKRKVAVLKAQGKNAEAIRELTEYLKKFMSDAEAWQELSDLYAREGDYARAAYCIEEIILAQPHNHLYYTRYAELKYTQGGAENIDLARTYFCQAVKLNKKNVRALYGVILCCASASKLTSQKKKDIIKLSEWAQRNLMERYNTCREESVSQNLESIQESMEILAISDRAT